MVINDPKGELLCKFYVKGTVRGYNPIQFNLINPLKTDIYNPLGLAADAAREGDFTKCAAYVENIASVFFPINGSEDPLWPNAANNAFKRTAYGLIDFYLEREKEFLILAEKEGRDEKYIANKLDQMWGQVTLYNCYQLFVQLSSKTLKNPMAEFKARAEAGDFNPIDETQEDPDNLKPGREPLSDEEFAARKAQVIKEAEFWNQKPEDDVLTLFFTATMSLPQNSMRRLIGDADNSLRAMKGAEKMLASVYGIAITAMSFFTDPTISTLTSGTPSQNVDLGSLSFPRCVGVRFDTEFITKYGLTGMQVKWTCYSDKKFENQFEGKDFVHTDLIGKTGWAMGFFKGIFPKDVAYLKLEILNPSTEMLIQTFYFEFRKSYQTSLDGRYYVEDPVLHEKIVKNGILTELKKGRTASGEVRFKKAKSTFKQQKIADIFTDTEFKTVETNVITQTKVRYTEKPKMIFLVTPPHLMKYAKLILILITQLVNLNFDRSYMTKDDQKPQKFYLLKCCLFRTF